MTQQSIINTHLRKEYFASTSTQRSRREEKMQLKRSRHVERCSKHYVALDELTRGLHLPVQRRVADDPSRISHLATTLNGIHTRKIAHNT